MKGICAACRHARRRQGDFCLLYGIFMWTPRTKCEGWDRILPEEREHGTGSEPGERDTARDGVRQVRENLLHDEPGNLGIPDEGEREEALLLQLEMQTGGGAEADAPESAAG